MTVAFLEARRSAMSGSTPPFERRITPRPVCHLWHPVVSVARRGVRARACLALFCCGGVLLVSFLSGCGAGITACTACHTPPSLTDVSMVSANQGWAVGSLEGRGVLVHYQGGQWSPVQIS